MKTGLDEKQLEEIKKAYEEVRDANSLSEDVWLKHVVFTAEWWVAVCLVLVPWTLWFIFRKKNSTDRLLYAGIFVISIASWLDFIGIVKGLWVYHVDVIFTIPAYILWDFSIMPVFVMFLLQVKPGVHPFWKALFFAGSAAFVGEPVFTWIGFYEPLKWSIFYSFPIYVLIYLAAYYLASRNRHEPLR